MAPKSTRRPPRTVTPDAFAKLKMDLERCTAKLEHLEGEIAIHIRRMAAMQAELDHLRALAKR